MVILGAVQLKNQKMKWFDENLLIVLLLAVTFFTACEETENGDLINDVKVTGLGEYSVLDLVIDDSNTFWLATIGGLFEYDGKNWTQYTSEDGLICDTISVLSLDKNGKIWIGTLEGLSCFDGENWTNYTTADGMLENDIRTLTIDKDNNLWIGTRNNGL